jgi:hypothetical protein
MIYYYYWLWQCTQYLLPFEFFVALLNIFSEREREIKVLGQRLKEMQKSNADLLKELGELTERETRLQEDMECEKEAESSMEQQLYNLWTVPTMFYISSEVEQDSSETIPVLICLPDGS